MAGYIGSKASVVSSGAERKKTFAITTNTTSLTGLSYTVNQVHVFHNGVRLVDGTDYTATNGTSITLTSAAENGDEVVVISYATFQTSDTVSASAGGTFAGDVNFTGNVSVDGGTIKLDGNYPVGTGNVALGDTALDSNVSGASNTAIGADALTANTASYNTVVGYKAGYTNATGASNTYIGTFAGEFGTGGYNTYVGDSSGYAINTGTRNTILGRYNGNQGGLDIRTSSNNIVLSDGDGNPRLHINSAGLSHFSIGLTVARDTNLGGAVATIHSNNAQGLAIGYGTGTNEYRRLYHHSTGLYFESSTNQAYLNSSGAWVNASDVTLKKDIEDIDYGLETIKSLKPRKYKMKSDDEAQIGFIAQELAEQVPEIVGGKEGLLGVSYGQLTAVLTKAIQEQQALIESLTARIETLEAKVTALEAN
jgi:hypothetical protein